MITANADGSDSRDVSWAVDACAGVDWSLMASRLSPRSDADEAGLFVLPLDDGTRRD